MGEYKPYEYNNKTILIDRYIILGEQYCDFEKYDLFDMQINTFAVDKIVDLAKSGYENYKLFTEQSHELLSSFKSYTSPNNKKIYLYTEVYSKTKTKIIISILCAKGKLWVNEKCLSIHHCEWATQQYVTVCLKKGKNVFLLERYSPKESDLFSIQLRNYRFEMSNDFRALTTLGNTVQINPLTLISEPLYNTKDSKFKFMYFLNDNDTYDEEYRIAIHDSNTEFIKNYNAKINQVIEIDIAELRALHEETLRYVWIGCIFKENNGKDFPIGFGIFLNDFDEKRIVINDKAMSYGYELSHEVNENIIGRLNRQKLSLKNNDYISLFWYTWQLKDIITRIENGNYSYNSYNNTGIQEFYIHSDLDDSNIRMYARIPKNFDKDKAYPVILALSTGNEGWFCSGPIEENIEESCICFDVTGRGFTGGSYIGEASTLEIIDWIKINYKIDDDRIYLLGQSNGGYATYSIAQNYPNLSAAIFPQLGNPNIKTVVNLLNTPTYQMVSPKDYVFIGHVNEVKNAINKFGNYHQYDFKEMTHYSMMQYIYHKNVLNEMLKTKRNLYPNKIIYITEHNRHVESFWIKLHGISKGNKVAKIKAEIVNNKLIEIIVKGSDGITVTLTPQIDRQDFAVKINNKVFNFKEYESNKIIFRKDKVWAIAESELPIDYRKGTGLLDIYLNNMRIILPKSETKILRETAENFARPFTNGVDPVVYTNYPIYLDNEVPAHILSYNLIIFDVCGNNTYAKRFSDKLMVKYDEKGYEYKGAYINAEYVIMQVIPNPYNSNISIMIISTNNDKQLRKNLFTRKVVIPYYVNGLHPYWNNEALIFDGSKYYRIYEWDTEIEEIK